MIYVYIDLFNSPIMGAFLWRHVQGHFFSVSESLLIVTWTFVNTSCLKLLHGCAATVNQDLWQLTLWIHIIIIWIFDSALSQSILINIMTLILHGPALACVARPQIICNQFFQFILSQAFPVLGCLMTNVQIKHCLKWKRASRSRLLRFFAQVEFLKLTHDPACHLHNARLITRIESFAVSSRFFAQARAKRFFV